MLLDKALQLRDHSWAPTLPLSKASARRPPRGVLAVPALGRGVSLDAFSGGVGPRSFQPHARRPVLSSLGLAQCVRAKAGQS